jgi:hypothetical protein
LRVCRKLCSSVAIRFSSNILKTKALMGYGSLGTA